MAAARRSGCPPKVLAVVRVDLDLLPLLDKHGNHDLGARLEHRRLLCPPLRPTAGRRERCDDCCSARNLGDISATSRRTCAVLPAAPGAASTTLRVIDFGTCGDTAETQWRYSRDTAEIPREGHRVSALDISARSRRDRGEISARSRLGRSCTSIGLPCHLRTVSCISSLINSACARACEGKGVDAREALRRPLHSSPRGRGSACTHIAFALLGPSADF